MTTPEIPVSWGELIDKITILEIKTARLKSETALHNVQRELSLLNGKAGEWMSNQQELMVVRSKLAEVNGRLWDIEDKIREKDLKKQFDAEFIELARSVYRLNDERAALKREINLALSSELFEEKSYASY